MNDDVREEFEDLGEEDVRKRVAQHIWDVRKERLARQWLKDQETALARKANELAREANDLARKANDVAKEASDIAGANKNIAMWALAGAVIAILVSIASLVLN